MYNLVNEVSAAPENCNIGYNNSWLHVDNDANRELFAQASYVTNFEDFAVTLSAGNVNIGGVELKDWNSNIRADIVAVNGYNALRVITQDLECVEDDISIGDRDGNFVSVDSSLSALNVKVVNSTPLSSIVTNTNLNPVSIILQPTQLDSFGRLRTSSPLTLFDSSHRYNENNLWSSLTNQGGNYTFNLNQGLLDMTVGGLSGSSVIRESTKVFSYQPGKSLLILNTFVMAPSTNNLKQRVGYFGKDNGIYFQLNNNEISFVKRTLINGSPSTEIIIPRSSWNGDKLDGNGPSGYSLDITKSQIMWMDIEWLGVGTVRVGFIINGQYIVCHSFHHANIINSTYISTASLPIRYEIINTGETGIANTLKQICSTVISEGGYELRGTQQAIGTPIQTPKQLTTAGVFYPIVSLRLKNTKLDAIVIITAVSLMGTGNGINYNWRLIENGITNGGTWGNTRVDSSIEYNTTGTSISGGRILANGYLNSSNQGSPTIDILKDSLFKFQLERNGLTETPYEFSLVVASGTGNQAIFGSLDWEEISK
jgi:hypothetical protein